MRHDWLSLFLGLGGLFCFAGGLSGCTPGLPVEEPAAEWRLVLPNGYSLLDIGRSISDGQVDIYDPGVSYFDIPPRAEPPAGILFEVPSDKNMYIRDDRVTVYSLDSDESAAPWQRGDDADADAAGQDPESLLPKEDNPETVESEVLPP